MALTKSGFLEYRSCNKAFWLATNRPREIMVPPPDPYALMLMKQGYEVEALAQQWIRGWPDAGRYAFQESFRVMGLEARADVVRRNDDGSIDLFEIKSSTSLQGSSGDHVDDATFQTIVAERAGLPVNRTSVIHVNKQYARSGPVDPSALLVVADVTLAVRERYERIEQEIDTAVAFLAENELDENGCSCRFVGNPANHCVTFARFNPDIELPSLYILPRISRAKLTAFDAEKRFALDAIDPSELSKRQALVQRAALQRAPAINRAALAAFIVGLEWPLYFYDYETFGAAIPIADGHKPHEQMPVQYSVHRLEKDGRVFHAEFLADRPGMQRELVDALEAAIGVDGHIISWNMSFETACNNRMAALLPDKAAFLAALNARTRDLMKPFEEAYVDARFGGSTSIKRVLPILVPTLAYSKSDVHDGTGAMEAWLAYSSSADEAQRAELRRQLLAYCELDTRAMVEIFAVLRQNAGD